MRSCQGSGSSKSLAFGMPFRRLNSVNSLLSYTFLSLSACILVCRNDTRHCHTASSWMFALWVIRVRRERDSLLGLGSTAFSRSIYPARMVCWVDAPDILQKDEQSLHTRSVRTGHRLPVARISPSSSRRTAVVFCAGKCECPDVARNVRRSLPKATCWRLRVRQNEFMAWPLTCLSRLC
jgi:hypothetical protein